jgi:hypothetical protein
MRGRPWGPNDRTGGPIDDVLDRLRAKIPGLIVEQLEVSYPADDDNVYFLGDGLEYAFVQIDTRPGGEPPFFIEATDRFDERFETSQVVEASARVVGWFREKRAGA